jgi:hypothetical protein
LEVAISRKIDTGALVSMASLSEGPKGRPTVLETSQTVMHPRATRAAAAKTRLRGHRTVAKASAACARPVTTNRIPKGRYSDRWSGTSEKWIAAAPAVSRPAGTSRPSRYRLLLT